MTRSNKRRLIRARIKLNQTLQQILDINRNRKKLPFLENALVAKESLDERLKVLNKTAEHQAKLIKHYEAKLENIEQQDEPMTNPG
ncbi:MAG: hypothetical protein AAF242_04705 [Bacteroidota bacterium]